MKSVPRLLPLIAVAMGGVVAVKVLADVQVLPQMLSGARALADAPQPHAALASARPSPLPPGVFKPHVATAAPAAAAGPTPACAQSPAELAKEAGLSPGELETLQNLGARRGQLDDRARTLDTQLQLLAAAETKVDAKMKALNALKAQMQGLLGQADQKSQAEIDRLVIVYQKMKPRDAAAIMATLDDQVRIPVAARMKEAALAAILAQMPTTEAKKLTENLAHRFSGAETLSQAADPSKAQASGSQASGSQTTGAQAAGSQAPGAPASQLADNGGAFKDGVPASKPKPAARRHAPRRHAVARARPSTPSPAPAAPPAAAAKSAAAAPAPAAPAKPAA